MNVQTFGNDLEVLKGVRTLSYNQKSMADIIRSLANLDTRNASTSLSSPASTFQTYHNRQFLNFEYFERIQMVPLNFPSGISIFLYIYTVNLTFRRVLSFVIFKRCFRSNSSLSTAGEIDFQNEQYSYRNFDCHTIQRYFIFDCSTRLFRNFLVCFQMEVVAVV